MVKLRLKKTGKKKQSSYQIIAIDSRAKRDGRYLEKIGHYFPLHQKFDIDTKKALKWLNFGAQTTETVRSLFKKKNIIQQFKINKLNLKKIK